MIWPDALVALVGLIYLATFLGYAWRGEVGLAIMFLGYAVGQIGILWKALYG